MRKGRLFLGICLCILLMTGCGTKVTQKNITKDTTSSSNTTEDAGNSEVNTDAKTEDNTVAKSEENTEGNTNGDETVTESITTGNSGDENTDSVSGLDNSSDTSVQATEAKTQEEDSKKNDTTSEATTEETESESGEVIEITEKMYVSWINEIYTNPTDYLGKQIKIEGMFSGSYYEETGKTYYYVYRVGPGCCGNDGSMCGFELTTSEKLPSENDWIEVVGTLEQYEEDGNYYLNLKDSKITVKTERGKENVNV